MRALTGLVIAPMAPLKKQEIWSIRVRLQLSKKTRDLALLNLAIDSELRGCDLVKKRIRDASSEGSISKIVFAKPVYEEAMGKNDSKLMFITNATALSKRTREVAKQCNVEILNSNEFSEVVEKYKINFKQIISRLDENRPPPLRKLDFLDIK